MSEQKAIEPRRAGCRDAGTFVAVEEVDAGYRPPAPFWHVALCFVLCSLTAALLQWQSGAFHAEFSGYPDEPAHYVTGLMLTEYVRQGFPGSLIRFAEDYYIHYPKVAIGFWPPVFYVLQAGWCLLFSSSTISVLLLNAILTAGAATLLYCRVSTLLPILPSMLLSFVYVLLPVSQRSAQLLMAEPLLVLFSFLAVLDFARFWETGSARHACLYGLWTGLAILTKGSGLAALLIPAFAILFTRKWRMILNPRLLAGVGIALALALPWTTLTARLSRSGWAETGFSLSHTLHSLWLGPLLFVEQMGFLVAALFALGLCRLFVERALAKPLFLSCLAGIVSVVFFHFFPVVGIESRRYQAALPPALILCAYGLQWLSRWRPFPRSSVLAAATVAVVAASSLPPEPKLHTGYHETASIIASYGSSASCVVLVAADVMGEGQFIAETALLEHRPTRYILRATQQLASMRWVGADYKLRYNDLDGIAKYFQESPVTLIVTDDYPDTGTVPHNQLVKAFLKQESGSWELLRTVESAWNGRAFHIYIYANKNQPCLQNPHIDIDMREKLGRILIRN